MELGCWRRNSSRCCLTGLTSDFRFRCVKEILFLAPAPPESSESSSIKIIGYDWCIFQPPHPVPSTNILVRRRGAWLRPRHCDTPSVALRCGVTKPGFGCEKCETSEIPQWFTMIIWSPNVPGMLFGYPYVSWSVREGGSESWERNLRDIHGFQQRKRVQFLWVPTASAEMHGRTSHLALGCSLHPLETKCCRKLARTICWQSQNTFHLAMGHGPIIKCLRLRVARARASKGPATNLGVQLKSDSNGCSGWARVYWLVNGWMTPRYRVNLVEQLA